MIELLDILYQPLYETIYMVLLSALFAFIFGIPMGIILVITSKNNLMENKVINVVLSTIVNIGRSFPYIILMVVLRPFSKILLGTSIGINASIVSLTIASIPFAARIIESAILEIDKGKIEAALAMGSSNKDIILRVFVPECKSSIILGVTLTIINLIGYSAMAGALGGGGLGDLAIRYGYYRFDSKIMLASVVVIIILVQGTQYIGNKIAYSINKKVGKI